MAANGNYENDVKRLFSLDSTRQHFVLGHVNSDWFSPKAGGSKDVKVEHISPDEVRINSRDCLPSRPKIYWNNSIVEDKDVSISERNQKGFCYSSDDIQNIDFVFYVEYKGGGPKSGKCNSSHNGDSISAVPDTSHDGGKNAAACYHLNIRTLEKGVQFKKERKHGDDYVFDNPNTELFNKSLEEVKKIGFRALIWNIDSARKFVAQENWVSAKGKHLEIWIDEHLDNQWKKIHEIDDTFDKGFSGNKTSPPIIGCANEAIFKTNNLDIVLSKLIKAPILDATIHPLGTVI